MCAEVRAHNENKTIWEHPAAALMGSSAPDMEAALGIDAVPLEIYAKPRATPRIDVTRREKDESAI